MQVYLPNDKENNCVLECIKVIYQSQLPPAQSETARVSYVRLALQDGSYSKDDIIYMFAWTVILFLTVLLGCFCGYRCSQFNASRRTQTLFRG